MTLEDRLMTYDWQTNFQTFAEATHRGSFKPVCTSTKGTYETPSESHYPRIIYPYVEPTLPCVREQKQHNNWSIRLYKDRDIGGIESDESNSVERGQLVRNKVLRSSDASSLAAGSATRCASIVLVIALLVATFRWITRRNGQSMMIINDKTTAVSSLFAWRRKQRLLTSE